MVADGFRLVLWVKWANSWLSECTISPEGGISISQYIDRFPTDLLPLLGRSLQWQAADDQKSTVQFIMLPHQKGHKMTQQKCVVASATIHWYWWFPVLLSKEVYKWNFWQYGQMEKQRWEESERRSQEVTRSETRKSEKKEGAGARKGRKVAIHYVFPMICGSGGSKSRLAKAAGAEPSGQIRDENLHAVVARSTFPSQNVQNWGVQTTFGSSDVEKVSAVVVRCTFPRQKCQKLTDANHFVTKKVHTN